LTALKVVVTKGGHTLAAAAAVDSVELPRAWLSEDTTVPDVEALGRWAALPDSPPAATSQTSQISGPAEGAPIEISTGFMRVQMVYNEETPDYGFMYNAQIQRTYSSNIFIVRNTGPTFTVNFAPPTVSSNFMGANISTDCGALGPNEECSIRLSGFARVEDHSYTATITLGMDMTIPGQTLAEPRLTTQFLAISD
jgi:hypothetical protein